MLQNVVKFENLQDLKDYLESNLEKVKTVIAKKTGLTAANIKIEFKDKSIDIIYNHAKDEFQTIRIIYHSKPYNRFRIDLQGFKYSKSSKLYAYNNELIICIAEVFNVFKVGYYVNSENTKKPLEKSDTRKTQKTVINEQAALIEQLKRENAELLAKEKKAKTN
jgi:asparagine N-glycosylation enzyme membrane subunit Stt3